MVSGLIAESDPEMWSGTSALVSVVERCDRRRGVNRTEILGAIPIDALMTSAIRRETARLRLARDAAAGKIPGETPKHPTKSQPRAPRQTTASPA